MRKRTITYLSIAALIAAACVAILVWRPWKSLKTPPKRTIQAVAVAAPATDTLDLRIAYLGTLEGEQDAQLGFRTGGTISALYVGEAKYVNKGQLLAELDQPEMAARVQRAHMELSRAELNLQHWQRELAIDERLFGIGAVSASRLGQTRLAEGQARTARDAALAGVEEAKSMAGAGMLHAPLSGIIGRIERNAGETVMPGQPVLQLAAGNRRIRVDVLGSDLTLGIGPGTLAVVSASGCGQLEGVVTRVDFATRPPFQSVRTYVVADDTCLDGLPSGASIGVTFMIPPPGDALLLPLSAIDHRSGKPGVFRVSDDGVAERIPVDLGTLKGSRQQLFGAIGPADRIVVAGTSNVEPGERVLVVDSAGRHSAAQRNASLNPDAL